MSWIDIYSGKSSNFLETELKKIHYLFLEGLLDMPPDDVCGELQEYPNCCGYAVYTDVYSDEIEEATKFFKQVLEANKEAEMGFGCIQCTVTCEDRKQILIENEWELIDEFLNYGSGNTIYTLKYSL